MSLIEKLTAALDETERIARAAVRHPSRYNSDLRDHEECGVDDGEWTADRCEVISANPHRGDFFHGGIMIYDEGGHNEEQAKHIAHNDPAHVLRQVAVHRKILDQHEIEYERPAFNIYFQRMDNPRGRWLCLPCSETIDGVRQYGDGPACPTVLALAEAYGIEVE